MKKRIYSGGVLAFSFALITALATSSISEKKNETERKTEKNIILTFDDGPRSEILKELLPVLEKYHVPGTFFVMGWRVPQNKDLVKKMHQAGHEIENHSYGHENFKKLFKEKGAAGIKTSLKRCDEAIFQATGKHSRFFRPPLWEINEEIEKIVRTEGYLVMKLNNPDINTEDYLDFSKHHPPEVLIEKVKKIIQKRERQGLYSHVLVFHELPLTAEVLKELIPYFQNQGYEFNRLDEFSF